MMKQKIQSIKLKNLLYIHIAHWHSSVLLVNWDKSLYIDCIIFNYDEMASRLLQYVNPGWKTWPSFLHPDHLIFGDKI